MVTRARRLQRWTRGQSLVSWDEGQRGGAWAGVAASVLGPRSQACVDEVPPWTHCEGAVVAEEALGTSLALPVGDTQLWVCDETRSGEPRWPARRRREREGGLVRG